MYQELKTEFEKNIQGRIDVLHKKVSKAELRLTIFAGTLFSIVLVVLYSVNTYGLHIMFFIMTF